jgi:hypothetical protein
LIVRQTAANLLKNIQVIDGAENCVYDIFAAPAEVFDLVFTPGTDVAFTEELKHRRDAQRVFEALGTIWETDCPRAKCMESTARCLWPVLQAQVLFHASR